jgi:hypothetical protein
LEFASGSKVKLLALTYSAWSEAQFSQIAYSPKIFIDNDMKDIFNAKKSGIGAGWIKIINLSFNKVDISNEYGTDKKKRIKRDRNKQKLKGYIDKYIHQSSQLRNRIAHGQWKNIVEYDLKELTDEKKKEEEEKNRTIEKKLNNLNSFDIMKEFKIHTIIGKMIRDLVQSPNKAFLNNYGKYVKSLEDYLEKTKNRNMYTKIEKLKKRPSKSKCPKCGFTGNIKDFSRI